MSASSATIFVLVCEVTHYKGRTIIAFEVAGELVSIIGVFYGGQDYETILKSDPDDQDDQP